MKIFCLQYVFHIIDINGIDKEQRIKIEYFEKIEDLLSFYRKKKNAETRGIKYNTNFKIFYGRLEEQDIKALELFL